MEIRESLKTKILLPLRTNETWLGLFRIILSKIDTGILKNTAHKGHSTELELTAERGQIKKVTITLDGTEVQCYKIITPLPKCVLIVYDSEFIYENKRSTKIDYNGGDLYTTNTEDRITIRVGELITGVKFSKNLLCKIPHYINQGSYVNLNKLCHLLGVKYKLFGASQKSPLSIPSFEEEMLEQNLYKVDLSTFNGKVRPKIGDRLICNESQTSVVNNTVEVKLNESKYNIISIDDFVAIAKKETTQKDNLIPAVAVTIDSKDYIQFDVTNQEYVTLISTSQLILTDGNLTISLIGGGRTVKKQIPYKKHEVFVIGKSIVYAITEPIKIDRFITTMRVEVNPGFNTTVSKLYKVIDGKETFYQPQELQIDSAKSIMFFNNLTDIRPANNIMNNYIVAPTINNWATFYINSVVTNNKITQAYTITCKYPERTFRSEIQHLGLADFVRTPDLKIFYTIKRQSGSEVVKTTTYMKDGANAKASLLVDPIKDGFITQVIIAIPPIELQSKTVSLAMRPSISATSYGDDSLTVYTTQESTPTNCIKEMWKGYAETALVSIVKPSFIEGTTTIEVRVEAEFYIVLNDPLAITKDTKIYGMDIQLSAGVTTTVELATGADFELSVPKQFKGYANFIKYVCITNPNGISAEVFKVVHIDEQNKVIKQLIDYTTPIRTNIKTLI